MALRRTIAAALVVTAAVLAFAPRAMPPPGTRIVVATHDLPAAVPLTGGDLTVRVVSTDAAPAGALTEPSAATGRMLVGAARAGEPLTDVRLLGRGAAVAAVGVPDAAGVPLRLADPAVAGLLTAGSRVDVVAVGARTGSTGSAVGSVPATAPRAGNPDPGGSAEVLASGAVVLGVLPAVERTATGPVVVVALPGAVASHVAAASLSREVTVTLR